MNEGRPPFVSENAVRTSLPDGVQAREISVTDLPVDRREALLEHIDRHYKSLLGRLAIKLQSGDAAADALHDLYLKLRSRVASVNVKSPAAYLYRAAVNVAHNNRQKEGGRGDENSADFDSWPDEGPGPYRIVAGRQDLDLALAALRKLPVRQRQIFLAWWQDEKSQAEIATLFGLHKRTVQKELARTEALIRNSLRAP